MIRIIEFLKQLETAVPPPPNCHHALTYAQYGSNETGWEDKLALQVNKGGVFHCFFLDENSPDVIFHRKPSPFSETTIAEIATDLRENEPGQLGVGFGQYGFRPQIINSDHLEI